MCQLRHLAARDVFDIQIVFTIANPAHSAAVGRELREHECRRRTVAAEFLERPAGEIEDPVVAARVRAPHLRRIREDQEFPAVGGPTVLLDVERRRVARRDEARRRDENRAQSRFGVVAHEVATGLVVGRSLERRVGDAVGQPGEGP